MISPALRVSMFAVLVAIIIGLSSTIQAQPSAACYVSGQVQLAGREGHAGSRIELDGMDVARTDGRGFFELTDIALGSHRIAARQPGFLSAETQAFDCQAGQRIHIPRQQLPCGDINRDEVVDLFDLVRVGSRYARCAADPDFDRDADLNQNGCVDLFDLVLVGRAYGLQSPGVWRLPSGRFEIEIAPIMQRYCIGCHGGVAGLSLHDFDSLMRGGQSGAVVQPGDAASSLLYRHITADDLPIMPPGGVRVSPDEIEVIRGWIEAGAPED